MIAVAPTHLDAAAEAYRADVEAAIGEEVGVLESFVLGSGLVGGYRPGESDLDLTSALMRFVFPSNLTGHPAVSFPAGYGEGGAPVGLQAIGRPWDEATLLRLAVGAEALVERRAPEVAYRLLGESAREAKLAG